MMKVILAGHSLEREVVGELLAGTYQGDDPPSPETIAAAYARISRYPEPVDELRASARADVAAARRSNRTIVFGMGHHSIAEHVQVNFDVMGISRLALEALEEARLCSYTEKSQRYITIDGGLVTPAEYGEEERELLQRTAAAQLQLYRQALPRLHAHQRALHPEMEATARDREAVEGWAKEDARYALGLSCEAQLGFSANARNLEHVIRKLRYHPLAEARELGSRLYAEAAQVIPSLIIHSDPEKYRAAFGREISDGHLRLAPAELAAASAALLGRWPATHAEGGAALRSGEVRLVDHSPDPDLAVCAALLFAGTGQPHGECVSAARRAREEDEQGFAGFVLSALHTLTAYDPVPRAFEAATFAFEIELSASAFAQLKRHRLATLLKQPYDPALPCTIPDSVVETGLQDDFLRVLAQSAEAHARVRQSVGAAAAEYLLTNAHRRRVLFVCNLRELYHIARVRMDRHAQWDIRRIAADLVALAGRVAPVATSLATGKDGFAARRTRAFSGG
ncbi:MAG: FAD-dependent thymidylate synthase [Deltaproteobacteria bacterium]|nr:FAD-dependent thymidylate synthase [Deltaproteobacteria bacterium]